MKSRKQFKGSFWLATINCVKTSLCAMVLFLFIAQPAFADFNSECLEMSVRINVNLFPNEILNAFFNDKVHKKFGY